MLRRISVGIIVLAGTMLAQPIFEVALDQSAEGWGEPGAAMPQFLPGGRFVATGVPLRIVIAVAYNVGFQSTRLSGGPGWIMSGDGIYDIEAKAAPGVIPDGLPSKARSEKMRAMLQALLADRFKLKIRSETKELPVYAMTVAKNGPKLEKAKIEEKDCPEPGSSGIACHSLIGGRDAGCMGGGESFRRVFVCGELDGSAVGGSDRHRGAV